MLGGTTQVQKGGLRVLQQDHEQNLVPGPQESQALERDRIRQRRSREKKCLRNLWQRLHFGMAVTLTQLQSFSVTRASSYKGH